MILVRLVYQVKWGKAEEVVADPEFQKSQARTEGLIESGRAEFYTIEAW